MANDSDHDALYCPMQYYNSALDCLIFDDRLARNVFQTVFDSQQFDGAFRVNIGRIFFDDKQQTSSIVWFALNINDDSILGYLPVFRGINLEWLIQASAVQVYFADKDFFFVFDDNLYSVIFVNERIFIKRQRLLLESVDAKSLLTFFGNTLISDVQAVKLYSSVPQEFIGLAWIAQASNVSNFVWLPINLDDFSKINYYIDEGDIYYEKLEQAEEVNILGSKFLFSLKDDGSSALIFDDQSDPSLSELSEFMDNNPKLKAIIMQQLGNCNLS